MLPLDVEPPLPLVVVVACALPPTPLALVPLALAVATAPPAPSFTPSELQPAAQPSAASGSANPIFIQPIETPDEGSNNSRLARRPI
jgi:hypothetical protein